MQKLRVKARGSAMCPDYEAMEARTRRYIGRKLVLGEAFKDAEGEDRRRAEFHPTGEVHEIPVRHEYVLAVKDGDLWAADEDTAKYCNVAFDPLFGVASEGEGK